MNAATALREQWVVGQSQQAHHVSRLTVANTDTATCGEEVGGSLLSTRKARDTSFCVECLNAIGYPVSATTPFVSLEDMAGQLTEYRRTKPETPQEERLL